MTLTHEHLLIDVSVLYSSQERASAKGFFHQPVSVETIGRIRHWGETNLDNSQLLDVPTAIEEAMLYKQYGGVSLVDATSIGIKRDPIGLARISRATGLNIIMGASYYVAPAHPPSMDSLSEDDIVEQIVRDVTEGVDGTNIKSGVIGEVGCSWPLTDNERKVLRASGRAQQLAGAPLLIHPGRDETAPLLEVLSSGLSPPPLAVDPGRFYRPGEKYNRLFLLGKPHGACEQRRKSPCTIGRVYRTFGGIASITW